MSDATETARRALVPEMPAKLVEEIEAGRPTWDTEELRRDFEVVGFMAPFVVVKRRSDGKTGTLEFTHQPRMYFGWSEE